jgi:hypothetical protein
MSTRCEIVRYRANMKVVCSLTFDKSVLSPERQLDGVRKIKLKNSLLRHSKFRRLAVQSMGFTPF